MNSGAKPAGYHFQVSPSKCKHWESDGPPSLYLLLHVPNLGACCEDELSHVWEALGIGLAPSQHSPNNTYYCCFVFQIFIWIGKDANEVERTESLKSGKQDPTDNDGIYPECLLWSSWLLFSPHSSKSHIKTRQNLTSFCFLNWSVMEFFWTEEFQNKNKKNVVLPNLEHDYTNYSTNFKYTLL